MKISQSGAYSWEYPEAYQWESIDSILATKIAEDIIKHLNEDILTEQRNLVPGLRKALNIMAELIEV